MLNAAFHSSMLTTAIICFQSGAVIGCELENGQPHRPQPEFSFTTYSEQFSSGSSLATTCVLNESNGDIEIRWLIPGPWGWIPEGEYLPRTRPVKGSDPKPLSSCLRYGNLGEMTVAVFYGDLNEVGKVEDEKEIGCEAARDEFRSSGGPAPSVPRDEKIESLEVPIRLFFPSDSDNPGETMLILEGSVGLKRETSESYGVFFGLELNQYEGRDGGDPSVVTVKAVFPTYMAEKAPSIVQAFSEALGGADRMPLQALNEVSPFITLGSETVALDEAFFDVLAEDGEQVARFGFPIYLPIE